MIKEALEFIASLKEQATAPIPLDVRDPRKLKFYDGDGAEFETDVAIQPRDHKAETLDDLIALANRFGADEDCSPVVWYSDDRVELVIDDAGHRLEKVAFNLEFSDVWLKIAELAENRRQTFDQKAFVRLLRIDLAGTLDPVDLLNAVRVVDFKTETGRSGEVLRGRESMGASIRSAVNSAAEIPETVTLRTLVYKTPGLRARYGVTCAVEVLPEDGKFQLIPIPDEIERVRQLAIDDIATSLREGLAEGIPAYQGNA